MINKKYFLVLIFICFFIQQNIFSALPGYVNRKVVISPEYGYLYTDFSDPGYCYGVRIGFFPYAYDKLSGSSANFSAIYTNYKWESYTIDYINLYYEYRRYYNPFDGSMMIYLGLGFFYPYILNTVDSVDEEDFSEFNTDQGWVIPFGTAFKITNHIFIEIGAKYHLGRFFWPEETIIPISVALSFKF